MVTSGPVGYCRKCSKPSRVTGTDERREPPLDAGCRCAHEKRRTGYLVEAARWLKAYLFLASGAILAEPREALGVRDTSSIGVYERFS